MAAGFGKDRRDVMYNDFIILGPDKDPAKIAKLKSAGAALKAIAGNKNSNFISRGDNSGTHVKELEVWQAAATKPSGAWYKEIGQGMSQAIMMAEQLGAYTLADRATWLAMKNRVKLKILYAGDAVLFNPYGIMTVNPEKWPRSNYAGAVALMEFFVSAEGRQLITSYKIDGEQCFYLPK
jgi:tungstate transport system substrate-binding protein